MSFNEKEKKSMVAYKCRPFKWVHVYYALNMLQFPFPQTLNNNNRFQSQKERERLRLISLSCGSSNNNPLRVMLTLLLWYDGTPLATVVVGRLCVCVYCRPPFCPYPPIILIITPFSLEHDKKLFFILFFSNFSCFWKCFVSSNRLYFGGAKIWKQKNTCHGF